MGCFIFYALGLLIGFFILLLFKSFALGCTGRKKESLVVFFFFFFNLFMAVLGLRFCARAFSSCGKRGPLFITVRGPLTIAASLVAEHRLQTCRLSNCGSRAQLLRGMWDLPSPGLEPASPALAGGLSTTSSPGKPCPVVLIRVLRRLVWVCIWSRVDTPAEHARAPRKWQPEQTLPSRGRPHPTSRNRLAAASGHDVSRKGERRCLRLCGNT